MSVCHLHLMGDTSKTPCLVPFCGHREGAEDQSCEFVRFPLDRNERNQWIEEISAYGFLGREPTYLSKICNCHFVDGDCSKLPSVFPWTEHPEYYKSPKTERAVKQMSARAEARQKLLAMGKDAVYCDTIFLTFNTSHITGVPKSSTTAVGYIQKRELLNDDLVRAVTNSSTQTITKVCTSRQVQTTSIGEQIEYIILKVEMENLKKEKGRLMKRAFGVHSLKNDDFLFKYYTGIGAALFHVLVKEVTKLHTDVEKTKLGFIMTFEDEVLLTLMKLRLNSSHIDLSIRFGITTAKVISTLIKTVDKLHTALFIPMTNCTVFTESGTKISLPTMKTGKMVVNVIDLVSESKSVDREGVSKPKNYMKVIIGVGCDEMITYCSAAFPNTTSKEEIFIQSDLTKYFKPGDLIMNDRDQKLLQIIWKDDAKHSYDNYKEEIRGREYTSFARVIKRLRSFQMVAAFSPSMIKHATKVIQLCSALSNYQNCSFRVNSTPREEETCLLSPKSKRMALEVSDVTEIVLTADGERSPEDEDILIEYETDMMI